MRCARHSCSANNFLQKNVTKTHSAPQRSVRRKANFQRSDGGRENRCVSSALSSCSLSRAVLALIAHTSGEELRFARLHRCWSFVMQLGSWWEFLTCTFHEKNQASEFGILANVVDSDGEPKVELLPLPIEKRGSAFRRCIFWRNVSGKFRCNGVSHPASFRLESVAPEIRFEWAVCVCRFQVEFLHFYRRKGQEKGVKIENLPAVSRIWMTRSVPEKKRPSGAHLNFSEVGFVLTGSTSEENKSFVSSLIG